MSFRPPRHARAIAVCIVWRGGSILVFEGHDSVKEQTFYRPLGGSIEFGELGAEAIVREFREEIGSDLLDPTYIGVLENLFDYEGHPGHEIVLVYESELASRALYDTQETKGFEDGGETFRVIWKPLSDFGPGGDTLYPDGLAELLSGS